MHPHFNPIPEPVGFATDVDNVSMVQKSVQHRCGDNCIVHELPPINEKIIAGNQMSQRQKVILQFSRIINSITFVKKEPYEKI